MSKTALRSRIKLRKKKRIKKRVIGTKDRPRLCVFRSNRHLAAQIIDDDAGVTLLGVSSSSKATNSAIGEGKRIERADRLGALLGEKAAEKGISKVVFDRCGYNFHGCIKALADGARKKGLKF